MRNVRKLLLLALGLIAMAAMLPSVASAQESVELYEEISPGVIGNHCPTVVADDHHLPSNAHCSINAESVAGTTADLYQHVAGVGEIRFSQCVNHFEGAFDENGEGYVYDQVLEESAGCGRQPCDEAEDSDHPHRNRMWRAHLNEVTGPAVEEEQLTVTFCLTPHGAVEGSAGTPCTVNLHVERLGHSYFIRTAPDVPSGQGGSPCTNIPGDIIELEGRWNAGPGDGHSSFLVHHLNDEVG